MFLHDAGQARHENIRDMADFWTEAVKVANVIHQELPRNESSSTLLRKVYLASGKRPSWR